MVGPGSPINASALDLGTFAFTPTPATEILEVTGNDYNTYLNPQDPMNVAAGVVSWREARETGLC